jgi:hypothetical protein
MCTMLRTENRETDTSLCGELHWSNPINVICMGDTIDSSTDQRRRSAQNGEQAHRISKPTMQHEIANSIESPETARNMLLNVVERNRWRSKHAAHSFQSSKVRIFGWSRYLIICYCFRESERSVPICGACRERSR